MDYTEQEREEISRILNGDYGASSLPGLWYGDYPVEEYEKAVSRLAELAQARRIRALKAIAADPRQTHKRDNRQANPL